MACINLPEITEEPIPAFVEIETVFNGLAQSIQKAAAKYETLKHNLACQNVTGLLGPYEMDLLVLNASGYLIEYEVKISRSDYRKDYSKSKWQFYTLLPETRAPNYFYYVCPPDMIAPDEVPEFAGLLYVNGEKVSIIKKPKLLHRSKRNRLQILQTFCRILGERTHLGSSRMTYDRNQLKALKQI